jgi:UDP-N-acetylmuramate: L-alanyl-gamma-D-glutamyl-meso-diaminopimelate ligase
MSVPVPPADPVLDDGRVVATVDPETVRRVHLLGVAGTGMGAFAGLLRAAGFVVTGSDQNAYPPMSEMLRAWAIPVLTPYAAANVDTARPDLVVVGNVIRRVNPEATEVRRRGVPQMSFPAALGALFLASRHPVVVAGTHGKTTTSALAGHVLAAAGRDPSFLIGGVLRGHDASFRLGAGPHFVVEGDEYDTAYFDKGPKFLHYRPRTAILTSVELDHTDIYRDLAHYESAFDRFVRLLPPDGLLAVSAAYPAALALARACPAAVVTYGGTVPGLAGGGPAAPPDYAARDVTLGPDGARFLAVERGRMLGAAQLPVGGVHNVENALGVIAALRGLGLAFDEIAHGLATFRGVRRRQELKGEAGGVAVIDDFAHHPTAVRETIAAVRARYPGRRLWAVFEPRSNTSRRNLHQAEYADALAGADRVSVKVPEAHDMVPADQRLDLPCLLGALRARGREAAAGETVEALLEEVTGAARAGDVVLLMSNGSFGGLPGRLVAALGEWGEAPPAEAPPPDRSGAGGSR